MSRPLLTKASYVRSGRNSGAVTAAADAAPPPPTTTATNSYAAIPRKKL